jgi:hypothetical protein
MAQAVNHRLLTAEAQVLAPDSLCICGRQNGTGTSFSFSPVSIIPPLLHIHLCAIWWNGMDNGSVSD